MVSVAVIVSTFNQPQHLCRCLLALSLQSFGGFEVVVADDGSDWRTRKTVSEFAAPGSQPITHVWQPNRGFRKTRILNQAVRATNAEYLVFIDGDCVAHPDFMYHHVHAAQPGYYLGGSIIRLSSRLSDAVSEEADFGNRLENYGVIGRNIRWSANLLHLHHDRPYLQEGMRERNLALVAPLGPENRVRAVEGFDAALDEPLHVA